MRNHKPGVNKIRDAVHLFTYTYKGITYNSVAVAYTAAGVRNFRITLDSERWFTMAPSVYPAVAGSILWIQLIRLGEAQQPNELIQAIGQGIEAAGIT